MAVLTIITPIKKIYPKNIALVKIGEFYHVYGKDAYILSYLFGYKLKIIEKNCSSCGFPKSSLNKVIATLENKRINYILLDRRNNYDVDQISDNNNLNTYEEQLEKAKKYVNIKRRIDLINQKLIDNMQKEAIITQIEQIEKILQIQ